MKVLRSTAGTAEAGIVRGLDLKSLPLGEAPFTFKENETETDAELNLPVEIRNDIARLEIGAERSAGAVQLLDKRWRRRSIGVVTVRPPTPRSRCLPPPIISPARSDRSPTSAWQIAGHHRRRRASSSSTGCR